MTGYRAFNRLFVKTILILSSEFELETEMTLHALDKRFLIKEIPIEYRDRPQGSISKLNTIGDGVKVIKTIVKMLKDFKPRKFFGSISSILIMIGLIVGIPVIVEFLQTGLISKMPSAILATGIMILALIVAQCGIILDTIVKQHKESFELEILKYKQLENLKNN